MQLQIECSQFSEQQLCLTCNQSFVTKEARLIVYNCQGNSQGEVCPICWEKGFQWLTHRVERLNSPSSTHQLLKPMKVA